MSLFSNSVGVATTATPNFYVDEYEGANIGQYGWTKADQGRYNQLIQYVDECRKIYDQIVEFSSSLAGIGAQVAEVNLIYNKVLEQKRLIDEIYASFNSDFGDFTTKYADFNVNYEAFKVSMADFLLKYAEVVVAAREAKDAATGAKLSETTAAAILKEVQDIYQELKEGQVYRGVWDPTTNTYPDPQGTNSIWDVNFTGKDEYVFDGKTWKPGHRLLCLIGPPREFQQIDTGTGGVKSINGKTGSVTLNADDVGALPTSGGTVSGSVHLRAPSKQVTFVNTNNYIGMGGDNMYIAALNDSTSRVILQSNRSPLVRMNSIDYNIYHENNKPTPADIGAVSLSVTGQKISGQLGYQMTAGDNAARGFDYYDKNGNTVARSGLHWENTTVKNFYFGAGGSEWAGGSTSWFSIKSGGEVYANGTNRVYHQGYKPSAVDVGALPLYGGNLTGDVSSTGKFIGGFTTGTGVSNLNTITPPDKSFTYHTNLSIGTANLFPSGNNANGVLTFHNHTGEYYHQIGLSSNGVLYHRGNRTGSWGKVYTEHQKPTAADIGAVNKAGDTMTGDLLGTGFVMSGRGKLGTTTTDGAGVQPSSIRLYSNLNLWMDAVDAVYLGANYGHSNNGWSKPSASKPSAFLRVHNNPSQFSLVCSDAGSTNPNQYSYRVYHEGFKPTAADVGAAISTKSSSDVNNHITAGFYNVAGGSPNWTGAGSGGAMIVMPHDSWVTQVAQVAGNSTLRIRSRAGSSASWKPWTKVYTETEKPTAAEVGALPSAHSGVSVGSDGTFLGIAGSFNTQYASLTAGSGTTDSNGWPNATNNDVNNFINRARVKYRAGNNALHFIANGAENARTWGIQSGHDTARYSSSPGALALNPFGGSIDMHRSNPQAEENGVVVYGKQALTSGKAMLYMNGTGTAGTQIALRAMREASNATLVWERVGSGQLRYSTGGNANGSTSIMLDVANSIVLAGTLNGSSQVQENGVRVYSPNNKPTAYDIELVDEKTKAISTVAEEVNALKEENQKLKAALLMLATKTGVTLEL